MLPEVTATRYVSPLREGGSLPGLVEADDLGTYVVKFRGAGQGLKALVAEVVVGELGRRLGVRVPDLRVVELDAAIGRYEADQEVQELLTASVGANLGVDFLPGSFGFDGVANAPPAEEAGRILWLDAFTANVDRTWRNPNLLVWHRNLWAIDHGAAVWFQHSWATSTPERFAVQPFDATTHVLGAHAAVAAQLDAELAALVTDDVLHDVLDAVPDDWLEPAPDRPDPPAVRALYVEHLRARRDGTPALAPGDGPMTGDPIAPERVGYVSFVVRCVPRVDREEFCNIGVVLYSQMADFLAIGHDVPSSRLAAFAPDLDVDVVLGALATMDAVCRGDASAGPLAAATRRERFGWLSAPRSTVVQPGPVHGGLTHDPAAELARLLALQVG